MQDEKVKLVDEILRLRKENLTLREELEKLKETKFFQKTKPKNFTASQKVKSKPSHQWGRKPGHAGAWRQVPDHIDREVKQTLSDCPDCHHSLSALKKTEEHIQEDIIPARVEVTRFVRYRYWCSHCKEVKTAPYAADEVPCGHLGPRSLSMMIWLKYHLALPGNKIKDILNDLCGLKVSEGAITQALQRLGNYLQMETEEIIREIKESSVKQVDETGWNINGSKHWLWSFTNKQWAFFHIDKSRGSKVPKEFLGVPHTGVVVSDFYSAYNLLSGDKQKCWVHLNRDIHNQKEVYLMHGEGPPEDFKSPAKKLKRLLADAKRLSDQRHTLSLQILTRKIRRIKDRLFDFGSETYSNDFWKKISGRILKHHRELLVFLDHTEVPSHNNAAERAIRSHVIIRNRSFQNRTDKGALAHSSLTSILQTLRLQNRDVVTSLATAYPKHRQGFGTPILFPAKN